MSDQLTRNERAALERLYRSPPSTYDRGDVVEIIQALRRVAPFEAPTLLADLPVFWKQRGTTGASQETLDAMVSEMKAALAAAEQACDRIPGGQAMAVRQVLGLPQKDCL